MTKKIMIGVGISIAAARLLIIGVAVGKSSAPSPKVACQLPDEQARALREGRFLG
jgi:hypothetical protein